MYIPYKSQYIKMVQSALTSKVLIKEIVFISFGFVLQVVYQLNSCTMNMRL